MASINQLNTHIIQFAKTDQTGDLDLTETDISVDVVTELLESLGFEQGEEQIADNTTYSDFHHDSYPNITIKQGIHRNE